MFAKHIFRVVKHIFRWSFITAQPGDVTETGPVGRVRRGGNANDERHPLIRGL